MDILAQQLRAAALEAEASRLRRFARDAPIGIVFLGADGRPEYANDEYLRISGRSLEELEAERFRLEPGTAPGWLHPERGSRYETTCRRADGTSVPILVGLSAQQEGGLAAFVVDLTAEKAAARALQASEERARDVAAKLAEADRRKDEFFSALSHELRNPLAPIRNALHLLARAPDDREQAGRACEVMQRQVTHLTRLVDDLLDVTRMSRGRVELRRAPLDLTRLVRETVEDHRADLEAAGLEVVARLPADPIAVEGDATRLAQVLGNLLQNAAKFTPRGGTVAVRLGVDPGGGARVEVRDTGEGIAADVLPHIFEPFTQGDRSLARSRGGLGLGLTLVKALVELHGGSIEIASPGPGAGTRVVVRLPIARARHAAAPPEARAPGVHAGAAQPATHVLVVEDNVDAAETLRDALELEGMSVSVAGDGDTGVEVARRTRPDVVICDIGLPGRLDGYGVAREMRADPALRRIPLVALTGYAGPEDKARAREAGFDRHFAKPVGLDELLRAIAPLAHP